MIKDVKVTVVGNQVQITMPKSEAAKYCLALEEAAGMDVQMGTTLKPRWRHLMIELRRVVS